MDRWKFLFVLLRVITMCNTSLSYNIVTFLNYCYNTIVNAIILLVSLQSDSEKERRKTRKPLTVQYNNPTPANPSTRSQNPHERQELQTAIKPAVLPTTTRLRRQIELRRRRDGSGRGTPRFTRGRLEAQEAKGLEMAARDRRETARGADGGEALGPN